MARYTKVPPIPAVIPPPTSHLPTPSVKIERMTPLHAAVAYNELDVVAAELKRGVDVNIVDEDGYPPLMVAAVNPAPGTEMLQLLLEHGADVNAAHVERGDTALGLAIEHGTLETVEALLEAGANIDYQREGGYDALLDALHSNTMTDGAELLPLVELLLSHNAPLNGESDLGETALTLASEALRFDVVLALLQAGSDARQLGWDNLKFALVLGEVDDVRHELAQNPDLEAVDSCHRTSWLLAVELGDIERIELLHQAGGEIEAQGVRGRRPLMIAAENGDAPVVSWLLERGAQIDAQDELGDTALMIAAQSGATECVRLLLEAGADVTLADASGADTLDMGVLEGFDDMLVALDPEFAEQNPDFKENLSQEMAALPGLRAISKAANLEIVQLLVEAGEELGAISEEMRAELLGLEIDGEIDCTPEEYLEDKYVYFGDENPEKIDAPFWRAMVKSGASAYRARATFEDTTDHFDDAVWSYQRSGKSITVVPGGRIIEVGGEHEDSFDPDYTIYNDVFAHDGQGNFEIYAYPEEVFPPTAFHSATLAGGHVYLIGNLGYADNREPGTTPVYRLDATTYAIEEVETSGENPGWISRHRAAFHADKGVAGEIHVWGGDLYSGLEEEQEQWQENDALYVLDLESSVWRKESSEF